MVTLPFTRSNSINHHQAVVYPLVHCSFWQIKYSKKPHALADATHSLEQDVFNKTPLIWYLIKTFDIYLINTSGPGEPEAPPSRHHSSPRPVHLALALPLSAAQATLDIKEIPIDAQETVKSKPRRHAGPRITDD